jgi:sugar phosphate isomerase/epimerase
MKLGINTYTFMWSIGFEGANPAFPGRAARPKRPMTALDLLEKARALGLSLVQTGPNLDVSRLPAAEFERFCAAARDWGIELELGTRGLDYAHIAAQAGVAQRMGAKLIRTLPEAGGEYLADAPRLAAALRPLIPLLQGEGLRLGIENGRIPAEELVAALEEAGAGCAGVVLDMVNSLAVPEGWKDVSRRLARHVMCLHYKDFTIRRAWHMMGFICEGAPAGQGMVDAPWLLQTLRASPYDFNVIIEQWPAEQETVDATAALEYAWLPQGIEFLRRYIPD